MPLRLATRGSALALTQSRQVADALSAAHGGLAVGLVVVTTTGDRVQDRPLHEIGGKGLFTKEVELALLAGEADFAVHSFKDVPVTMPLVARAEAELVVAAVPRREDSRDALVTPGGVGVADLKHGASVGTTSLRRRAQLLALRPDLRILPLRGNVDTRLGRVADGDFDATVLAVAGLKRLGRWDEATMRALEFDAMLPAAGQGALALQCRRDDDGTRRLLSALDDEPTSRCVAVERDLVTALHGDCTSPIGALAQLAADSGVEPGVEPGASVFLRGCYESPAGLRRAEATGGAAAVAARVATGLNG